MNRSGGKGRMTYKSVDNERSLLHAVWFMLLPVLLLTEVVSRENFAGFREEWG